MTKKQIIDKTAKYIKEKMSGESSGHDWWHVYRVWQLAKIIGKKEKADMFIVELSALLHDLDDSKFKGVEKTESISARKVLNKFKVSISQINQISEIIEKQSFSSSFLKNKITSKEGMVVQDADRLDALGAIGVARAFAFGGYLGCEIYNPLIKPAIYKNYKLYKKRNSHTINHFYEKVLLLKDLINTKTAKNIAISRHKFIEKYLKEFYAEWEGKK